jgi:peptidoglycan hydrolase-like protein with peptidoglycan-binding domain
MRPVHLALAALLLLPATAAAQDPATVPPPQVPPAPPAQPAQPAPPAPPTQPTPPPPAPAAGTLSLSVPGTALAGERFHVRGRLQPAIAGEKVTVRFSAGGRKVRAVELPVGAGGRFDLRFTMRSAGPLTVRAVHDATAAVAAVRARSRRVTVLEASARFGARGASVRWLQRRLADLHYAVPRSGVFDAGTGRAVMAYRKLTGLARTEVADRAVFTRLARGAGAFTVRYPSHGRHVEGDLTHQVLALIDRGGRVHRIYTTSSGASVTPTILGSYRVYRKDLGTNAKGMVDASYFIRGYAIHGYVSVPAFPASHGCFRVPVPNAKTIFDWVRMGTRVDSYYR